MKVARLRSSFSFKTLSRSRSGSDVGVEAVIGDCVEVVVEEETVVVVDAVVEVVVDTEELVTSVVDVDSLVGFGSVEPELDTEEDSVTSSPLEVVEELTVVVVELTVVDVTNVVEDVVELVELDSVPLGSL